MLPLTGITVVASQSHYSDKTDVFLKEHKVAQFIQANSSLKFCRVAEGEADLYPRFGTTMEWDTAAGQAILQEANASLIDFKTNAPMKYNRENLLNNWFIAKR